MICLKIFSLSFSKYFTESVKLYFYSKWCRIKQIYCPISDRITFLFYAKLIFNFFLNDIKVSVLIF